MTKGNKDLQQYLIEFDSDLDTAEVYIQAYKLTKFEQLLIAGAHILSDRRYIFDKWVTGLLGENYTSTDISFDTWKLRQLGFYTDYYGEDDYHYTETTTEFSEMLQEIFKGYWQNKGVK